MLEKSYDAASVEPKIANAWDEAEAFRAGANARPGAEPFTIVIPPPNVTGSLHIGHAPNNTLQDIMVRFERMRGKDVLWQPRIEHARNATQLVVQRRLAEHKPARKRAVKGTSVAVPVHIVGHPILKKKQHSLTLQQHYIPKT